MNPAHWTKRSTPVFQRGDANCVYAPGHNGFFTSPDGTEDWIVYHANDSAGGGCDMKPATPAQRVTWNADGTPNFEIGRAWGRERVEISGGGVSFKKKKKTKTDETIQS